MSLETLDIEKSLKTKLDKRSWLKWRFSDLVENIVEKVVPKDSGLDHYIGLEHLDTGSLKIRRFGETKSLIGDKLRIYKGDLIFAKRNAYLKRVAIAEFDAVASAHSLVLRAKSENVLPEFLPFFLLSETFWQRAIEISVGSLSPTINWKVLSKQEFLLPPKEEQAQLAELLWAMDEVVEKEKYLLDRVQNVIQTLTDQLFSKKNSSWDYISLEQIAEINANSLSSKTDSNYEFKYLDIASIVEPKVYDGLKPMTYVDSPSRARRITKENSIVLSMVRPYHRSFVQLKNPENIIASTGTAVVDVVEEHNSTFVFNQFFSKKFLQYCEDQMAGALYPSITPTDLASFKIGLPKNKNEELKIAEKFISLESIEKSVKTKISASKSLQKSLINEIF